MREIRSKDNRIVKRCEQLSMRKYRDQFGLYLIEGENLLAEAVKNHARIETVLLREGCQKSLPPQVADRTFLVDARIFDKLAQTVTSQGILAIVAKPRAKKILSTCREAILSCSTGCRIRVISVPSCGRRTRRAISWRF